MLSREPGATGKVVDIRARVRRSWRGRTGVALACALLVVATVSAQAPVAVGGDDPEAAFREREDLAQAIRATELWQARLAANPRDFESAYKLARARQWVGEWGKIDRVRWFRAGMEAAKTAIQIDPRRPEGYFWLGVNAGAVATVSNPFVALRMRSTIRESFETGLARDASYLYGAGHCALGKYYAAIPSIFGGDKPRAERLFAQCLAYDARNTAGYYYLAQMLVAQDRDVEARRALRSALDTPIDESFGPEIRLWKRRSARLLARLDAKP